MPQTRDLTSLRLERAGILPQSAGLSQASKLKFEEGLLKKQEEAPREPNPAKRDSDATGTTSEEQTGENMERREVSHQDDGKADRIPERISCDDEQEEKAYVRRGSYHNSELGNKASDKGKGPHHEDE